MIENKNNYSFLCEKSKSTSSPVQHSPADDKRALPFSVLLECVKGQIEFRCFQREDEEQAGEIAMIIAEVMKLPANAAVRIGGNDLRAEMVAEIYDRVTHEHVTHVMDNYARATYEIKHTKTYLRTALYNAVFELTSRIDNHVYTDMPWLAKK